MKILLEHIKNIFHNCFDINLDSKYTIKSEYKSIKIIFDGLIGSIIEMFNSKKK